MLGVSAQVCWIMRCREVSDDVLGARVTISVRRVKLAFASSFPKADVFERAARRLCT